MKRRKFVGISGILAGAMAVDRSSSFAQTSGTSDPDLALPDIERLRSLAAVAVGDLPIKINVTKVADTIRPENIVVEGADPGKKMTLARTVYQIVYPSGTILLDTGMDLETHRTFGKTEEPYYPENFAMVNRAMEMANLIVLTHYHADHTAGIVRSPNRDALAHKVWLSRDTADLMVRSPHKPTVHLAQDKVNMFQIIDFDKAYSLAPGLVVFRTPGHTPDSKMLYIKLANGQEFVHSVDSGWSMQNIVNEKMKNAPWVNEDKNQLLQQYRWLNRLMKDNKELTVLCTHDDEQYTAFTNKGLLGKGLIV